MDEKEEVTALSPTDQFFTKKSRITIKRRSTQRIQSKNIGPEYQNTFMKKKMSTKDISEKLQVLNEENILEQSQKINQEKI